MSAGKQQLKIALIGYGKMGQAIEQIALQRGHEVVLKINIDNTAALTKENLEQCDVAIEFTGPHSAVENIISCFDAGTPIVCGSTGWTADQQKIEAACLAADGSLIYASNFSIGVNLFFELNKKLAALMNAHTGYDVKINEVHHTQKIDAPSGTAITLAEQVVEMLDRKDGWTALPPAKENELIISSERTDPAPGTHTVCYTSNIDDISITHTAHNRTGFALGAVLAAEYIAGKKGIFTMAEVLGISDL